MLEVPWAAGGRKLSPALSTVKGLLISASFARSPVRHPPARWQRNHLDTSLRLTYDSYCNHKVMRLILPRKDRGKPSGVNLASGE